MPQIPPLNYQPENLPREKERHYISASDEDIGEMLGLLDLKSLDELFNHIPQDIRKEGKLAMADEMAYDELLQHVVDLANKNNIPKSSFIGHGLPHLKAPEISNHVLGLRQLTTAYTPYQPERSQGTLMTHWIYQSLMSMITGFEAINVSMYDRSTTLHEALLVGLRFKKKKNTCLVFESIFPGDKEVLETLRMDTKLNIEWVPFDEQKGQVDMEVLKQVISAKGDDIAALAFPQVNSFGHLEEADLITNLCKESNILSIAIIDPVLLAKGGLKAPVDFGESGADLFVAEGQHLAIAPSFGGPGLGVMGFRHNSEHKTLIRSAPGRFVGHAFDTEGRSCKTQVISAREQHIKREKATSNICSNEAFIATLAGAALLERGDTGLESLCHNLKVKAKDLVSKLLAIPGIKMLFPETAFFNEFTLELPSEAQALIDEARAESLHIGVSLSHIKGKNNLLKISLSDMHSEQDTANLIAFFEKKYGSSQAKEGHFTQIKNEELRPSSCGIPTIEKEELKLFYDNLAKQNVSPDDAPYPLGSCTMKYNPYINDYAAGLDGFMQTHPHAPNEDIQGNLEILFEIQEMFKAILGLPALTTQPVAGAQGELVGLKMMQAYHRDRGEKRDIMLIPRSAHGTNPATATYAGYETQSRKDISGVVLVEAEESGLIDMEHLTSLIESYGPRVAGIMVTNPNTSGLFEVNFKEIAQKIHDCGGLVYMDGANLNAIAGWVDLGKMGVDAVHSNLHKTWSIPHGGGGPGDAIVAVSDLLAPYLPGIQVTKEGDTYSTFKPERTIGSVHRHFGNFGHKIRAYTYMKRLGAEGVRRMSAVAVLSARYLKKRLTEVYEILPQGSTNMPCMHEFILGLSSDLFASIEKSGIPKSAIISRIGKLYLDYGFHAPTIAFPEVYGIMVEPTESYRKGELDRFADAVLSIYQMVDQHPEVLQTVPHFTPIDRVDDVSANRKLVLSEQFEFLPEILNNRLNPQDLAEMDLNTLSQKILAAHENEKACNP
ncbi:MAG: aminomethyl-transferring glycine dehydrogenase subunit GcvPB [Planctomycetes bacterium]|nr:aminomethyl-transferring glycine dehydrogenase subunit GcvPB [Planctomycetota bacterium]